MYDVFVGLDAYHPDKEAKVERKLKKEFGIDITGSGMGLWEGAMRDLAFSSKKKVTKKNLDAISAVIKKELKAKKVTIFQKKA